MSVVKDSVSDTCAVTASNQRQSASWPARRGPMPLLTAAVILASIGCGQVSAMPVVDGQRISWPDDGWYQVQRAEDFLSLCEGGLYCDVPAGRYLVVNHSTGQRFENVIVSDVEGDAPVVQGSVISWPDDGWYQVQRAEDFTSLCEGTRQCQVADGRYIVINHTTGQRFENVLVETGDDESQPPEDDPLPPPQVPELDDPLALPLPLPNPEDPFGVTLENDQGVAVEGGPPSQPRQLRLDLLSNDWAEINWAPAVDDGEVVQYTLYRSDGVRYEIRADQSDPEPGSQAEIDKYWLSTSFIDCNYTRFDLRLHRCSENTPAPGESYTYTVTATDDQGQESVASEALTVTYPERLHAPIPLYDDLYKGAQDRFVQQYDLSRVAYWLDDFDLVFNDEFDADAIDADKWQTQRIWDNSTIVNGEQQYMVDVLQEPDFGYQPFTFTGESMIINAIPLPAELEADLPPQCDEPASPARCRFLSGTLSSHDRFQFLYGYTEGRFRLSGAAGALSSFYLYHRYPGEGVLYHAPEIDIVEYLGENPYGSADAFQTYHFGDAGTGLTRSSPTMSHARPGGGHYADDGQWHTFGVLWEPQLVIWYIDGMEVRRLFGPQVSRQPMMLVNALITGSNWAPTPDVSDNELFSELFPIQLETDYIRVYQREAFQGTAYFGEP